MPQTNPTGIEVTLGYIQGDIASIKLDMKELKGQYATKEEIADIEKRLSAVEGYIRYIVLTVLGAVITGAIALLYARGGLR